MRRSSRLRQRHRWPRKNSDTGAATMAAIATLTMNPALDIATSTDRVEPTHKLRYSVPRYDPGGGGINVARGVSAGRRGCRDLPVGGPAGEMMRNMLREEGVAHSA